MRVSIYIKCLLLLAICTFFWGCGRGDKNNDSKPLDNGDYRQAVDNGNYNEAYRILADYRKEYREVHAQEKPYWLTDLDGKERRRKAEGLYYEAFDYIYKAEIRQILAEMDGEDAIDKVVFLLDEVPVEGTKAPLGLIDYYDAKGAIEGAGPVGAYAIWTQHFNGLCNSVLTLAINRKNKNLARQILMHFVDNVEITAGGDKKVNGEVVDGNHGYINYMKTDYNEACKKYEDAVKLGSFD